MALHKMKLADEWLVKMAEGEKTLEARLYDEKRQAVVVGDEIEFASNTDPSVAVVRTVTGISTFRNFKEMFKEMGVQGFGEDSKDVLLEELSEIYSESDEEELGVVAFELRES